MAVVDQASQRSYFGVGNNVTAVLSLYPKMATKEQILILLLLASIFKGKNTKTKHRHICALTKKCTSAGVQGSVPRHK